MPSLDPASIPIDELEVSVRSSAALASANIATLADLLATDSSHFDPRVAREVQAALADTYEITWGGTIIVPPFVPPAARSVPRLEITFEPTHDPTHATSPIDRVGGQPVAPSAATPWPVSESGRPMQLMFQLIGKAGGGVIDLGDVTVLQAFADMQGEYYEDGENAVVIHRVACPIALELPAGVEPLPVQLIRLTAGVDDRVLVDEWDDALEDEWNVAHEHGFCSKVWGVPVGANLDLPVEGEDGEALRHVAQFTSAIDDWFLWYVFANADFSEARLVIVRG